MTNIEAIKAKLLAKRDVWGRPTWTSAINPDGPEAAAVIDALVAENERLYSEVLYWEGNAERAWSAADKARAALKDAARD